MKLQPLEEIVKVQNPDPAILCDYAERVTFFSNKLYWCTYDKKCVYQTSKFYRKYCAKELERES